LATKETFKAVLERVPHDLLPRMNYVVFSATSLQALLAEFKKHLGGM